MRFSHYDGKQPKQTGGGSTIIIDSELSTESANPVQNKVITNAITSINNNLVWNKVENITGNTQISLPIPTTEIMVSIACNNQYYDFFVTSISNNIKTHKGGWYASAEENAMFTIKISNQSIQLVQAYIGGKDVLNSCVVDVSYR